MKQRLAIVLALGAICAEAAHAEGQDVRALAAGCTSCHQPALQVPPPLAGEPRQALIAKLRGFRDGTRAGTVMPQIAKGYTSAELDALATHFARQRPIR
jgi:cytochrome c553